MKEYDLAEELNNIDGKFFMDEVRNGFYISSMMKRYWAAQLRVLSEIDKVCKKHGIRWFADCGTLLGAVRHEGYIPWDDDLDICMFRDDLTKFCNVAPDELPEGYNIINIHTEEDFSYMITSVANSRSICTMPEFLKSNFGCPYVSTIDIFPLDALCPDKEEEEKRRKQLQDIVDAVECIDEFGTDIPQVRNMLTMIGQTHHMTIHRDQRAKRELLLLSEKIYTKYPLSKAEKVALMPFWVADHNHDYKLSNFDETVYLPFEYVHLPVPVGYDEQLNGMYRNYLRIYKDGGIHEYPAYAPQERILAKRLGGNPYRYTMPSELPAPRSIKGDREVCLEMSSMLKSAHSNIQTLVNAGNGDAAAQLLQGCQNLAVSLGTYIEEHVKGGENAVHILEEYCERLYEVSEAWNGEESVRLLDGCVSSEEEELDRALNDRRREVLFIPCRAEWWPTMEREWRRCSEDKNCDVYVMPIPYMIRDSFGEERSTYDDSALFPDYVKITKIADYDLEARKPDVVYIQAPYDSWNSMFLIPEYYYSEKLAKLVKKLVYIPCFEADLPKEPDDKNAKTLKVMAEQPALVYSDEVLVKNDETRAAYTEALVSVTGEKNREYWNKKIKAADLPDAPAPERGKKTLLFQVDYAFVKKYGEKALEKIREAIEVIGSSDELDCVFIPHITLTDGAAGEGETAGQCRELLELVRGSSSIIYDEKHELVKDFGRISAYYGTPGSLAGRCVNEGKPTMLMAVL